MTYHRKPIRGLPKGRFFGPLVDAAKLNGFDLNLPLETIDGDEVIVLTVDEGHPYPIVGEVHDYNANVGWLARWRETGSYRGTLAAAMKHSLYYNTEGPIARAYIKERAPRMIQFGGARPAGKSWLSTAIRAAAERVKLKNDLSKVYSAALADHSAQHVAAVAFHINRLLDEGRVSFSQGLVDFETLAYVVRLANDPTVKIGIRGDFIK